MERRDWSLKALQELQYIDSLESSLKADSLKRWVEKYLSKNKIEEFDLILNDLEKLSELFYKNIIFLKSYRENLKAQFNDQGKIREFLK